jgi:hypothetical protein
MVTDEEMVLDQSFTPLTNMGCHFNERSAFIAQTYRAGITGILSGVKLHILSNASLIPRTIFEIYPLHVAIRQVLQGFPSVRTLGEVVIEDGNAPPDRLLSFSDPIRQEAGTQYAIVVHYLNAPSAGAGQWLGNWYGATGDQYPDGELFYGPEGETWYVSSLKDHDVQFQTYVVPG